MAKRKTTRRRRGPNRPIDERIAELEDELEKLKAKKALAKSFSPASVRRHRAKLELSRADYARLVDVAMLTIYNWENGRSEPRLEQLERWLEVSKMSREAAWRELGY